MDRASKGLLGLLATLLLLVSCAGRELVPETSDYRSSHAERMFTAGYQDIGSVYIDEVPVFRLALAGMSSLHELDDALMLADGDEHLSLIHGDQEVARWKRPAADDEAAWARVTARVLEVARQHSSKLEEMPSEDIYESVFDRMLTELDGYSRYATREEARENRASRDGFGGVGVRIRVVDEGVVVVSVMENTPAERAGLQADDLILAIDGTPTPGLDQREVVKRLRGPLNSAVRVDVRRGGVGEVLTKSITRAHIVPQTVSLRLEGNVAYVRVSGFNQQTTRTLRDKIREVQSKMGPSLAGFVVDLRNNPGGLLDQAVSVADLFVTQGRIVSTHGRHPDSHQYFEAQNGPGLVEMPMVVLINGASASASEIVAAALQDSGRAVVIGSNSFGKGTVQTVLRLPNEGELTLTWARFHAPSGYPLDRRGVLPDVCTSGSFHGEPIDSPEMLLEQIGRGVALIDARTRQRSIDVSDETALAALRSRCPTQDAESEIDLQVAIELLRNPTLYAMARGDTLPATARSEGQLSGLAAQP